MNPDYHIKTILARDTHTIRHAILRQGQPKATCVFEGDDLNTTFHLGLFHHNQLIGVVSFMLASNEHLPGKHQYQLRGMALLRPYQNKGLGKLLIDAGIEKLAHLNCPIVWCHAREAAISFYNRNDFLAFGKPFHVPLIGTHLMMFRNIPLMTF